MASNEDVKEEISERRLGRIVMNTWNGWLGSLALSLVGGLMLSWWELKYHPTNDQQWMVPLGLILFFTPLIVWSSLFLSDFCNSIDPTQQSSHKKPFNDLER